MKPFSDLFYQATPASTSDLVCGEYILPKLHMTIFIQKDEGLGYKATFSSNSKHNEKIEGIELSKKLIQSTTILGLNFDSLNDKWIDGQIKNPQLSKIFQCELIPEEPEKMILLIKNEQNEFNRSYIIQKIN